MAEFEKIFWREPWLVFLNILHKLLLRRDFLVKATQILRICRGDILLVADARNLPIAFKRSESDCELMRRAAHLGINILLICLIQIDVSNRAMLLLERFCAEILADA